MTDDRPRCSWGTGDPLNLAYHDTEWGVPIHDDRHLFELLCLEGAQAGLSWTTILRKRDGYRVAFEGWDPERIAGYGDADVARLLADPGIVRNRAKILATITNARAALDVDLASLVWSFAPEPRPRPRVRGEVPPFTDESKALSKALKKAGFVFVGPTTAYAAMQACGLVDDHIEGCVA